MLFGQGEPQNLSEFATRISHSRFRARDQLLASWYCLERISIPLAQHGSRRTLVTMRYASLLLVVVSIATVSGLPVTGPPGPGGQVPGIPGDHLENDPMERWPEFRDWFAENEYDRYQECYQEFMAENVSLLMIQ